MPKEVREGGVVDRGRRVDLVVGEEETQQDISPKKTLFNVVLLYFPDDGILKEKRSKYSDE